VRVPNSKLAADQFMVFAGAAPKLADQRNYRRNA